MQRSKDTRDFQAAQFNNKDEAAAASAAATLSAALPGAQTVRAERVNPTTGSPVALTAVNVPTGAGDLVGLALACVQQQFAPGLGFSAGDAPEYVPDPHVQSTTSGKSVVHLQQQYRGIPIFEMTRSVHFGRAKNIERVVGDSLSIPDPVDMVPQITAATAVKIGALYLAANEDPPEPDAWGQTVPMPSFSVPSGYSPKVISSFDRPTRPTVLEKGPFGKDVQASLVFFFDGKRTRLAWKLFLTMPADIERYVMVIAADRDAGEPLTEGRVYEAVLLCRGTTATAAGNIFQHNPKHAARQSVDLPLPATSYPLAATVALPAPFPEGWWVATHFTLGNCASAVLGQGTTMFQATVQPNSVIFDPAQPDGADQALLNAFYFCNYMHDFFYQLGFDEAAGNFQRRNFSSAAAASDAVLIRVHPGEVFGTANMATPQDGQPPLMNLGTVSVTGGSRHTALDSDVVFHEYVHGVTNRLVGGRMNSAALEQPQSRGMGEGWGDYFALTIQNHGKPDEKVVTGDWVTDRPSGIRSAPYDSTYPNTYGDVGQGSFTGPHRIGEIWCATLMQMNRNLDSALGDPRGHQLGWRIVIDGLKLAPANPSFLDARDAILQALLDAEAAGDLTPSDHSLARRAAWEAFAQFGMGVNARTLGASLQGIVEDNSLPAGV